LSSAVPRPSGGESKNDLCQVAIVGHRFHAQLAFHVTPVPKTSRRQARRSRFSKASSSSSSPGARKRGAPVLQLVFEVGEAAHEKTHKDNLDNFLSR
jgi:hypothetical protein